MNNFREMLGVRKIKYAMWGKVWMSLLVKMFWDVIKRLDENRLKEYMKLNVVVESWKGQERGGWIIMCGAAWEKGFNREASRQNCLW